MNQDRWKIAGSGIVWDVANDTRLPHEDHIEMSGRKISVIVRYRVDENRCLTLSREIIWPTLRTKEGDPVPYPVEAYPEGGQAHLSAESALYGRVFTEGMFGLEPMGLRSFRLTPRLPQKWPQMALRNIHAFRSRL